MRPRLRPAPFHSAPSIRFSLLFWNMGILSLALLGFCACCGTLVRIRLLSVLDRQLTTRAQTLIQYWEQMPAGAREVLRQQIGARESGAEPFPLLARIFRQGVDGEPGGEPSSRLYRPRVLTLQGDDYFSREPDTPLDAGAFARAARGETVHTTIRILGEPARVLSMPMRIDGQVQGVVQTARYLGEYKRELQAVTNDLLAAIPFLLLVSAFGSLILTSRALKPVRTLREAVEQIEAEDLSLRLPTRGHDEFAQLAATCNHMLARLEQAFAQQARFIADASHELRTPLTVLRGNTSLALARPRSAEEYRETLVRAHRTIETMCQLVDELLLLSRADAARLVLEPERVRLQDVLHAAIEATRGREAHPIELVQTDGTVFVTGNSGLLICLFTNLLSNAVRHTASDQSIIIAVSRHGSAVVISVQDAGEGIGPEHLSHVCDRFYRVDAARASHLGGAGLGLAICRSIVQAHGGTLDIQSVLGQGTTVTVALPLAPPTA